MLVFRGGRGTGQVSGKEGGPTLPRPLKLTVLSGREVCGMRGVAVKCIDITKNSDCEGSAPAPY